MTTIQILIVAVAAIVIAVIAAAASVDAEVEVARVAGPQDPAPSLVGETVVVHTRKPDDQSIRGIVACDYADKLVLREASYVHASGLQPAKGEVEVLKVGISTTQRLAAPAEPV